MQVAQIRIKRKYWRSLRYASRTEGLDRVPTWNVRDLWTIYFHQWWMWWIMSGDTTSRSILHSYWQMVVRFTTTKFGSNGYFNVCSFRYTVRFLWKKSNAWHAQLNWISQNCRKSRILAIDLDAGSSFNCETEPCSCGTQSDRDCHIGRRNRLLHQ